MMEEQGTSSFVYAILSEKGPALKISNILQLLFPEMWILKSLLLSQDLFFVSWSLTFPANGDFSNVYDIIVTCGRM